MDSSIEQKFFQHLSELGFPSSSIIYDPVFQPIGDGRRYRPDFAIVDPNTNDPLAIIEIKSQSDSVTLSRSAEQVQKYILALRDKTIRGFVVTPSKSGNEFDFFSVDESGTPKQIPFPFFFSFDSLSSGNIATKKEQLAEEKKEATDQFLIVCFFAAGLAFSIAVADFILSRKGITLLTPERMTLIAAAIALIIIPYVQKFKGLGIEIDRTTKQNRNQSTDIPSNSKGKLL
jgi:hypothetical protein